MSFRKLNKSELASLARIGISENPTTAADIEETVRILNAVHELNRELSLTVHSKVEPIGETPNDQSARITFQTLRRSGKSKKAGEASST